MVKALPSSARGVGGGRETNTMVLLLLLLLLLSRFSRVLLLCDPMDCDISDNKNTL